jgi:hypothetical protein
VKSNASDAENRGVVTDLGKNWDDLIECLGGTWKINV